MKLPEALKFLHFLLQAMQIRILMKMQSARFEFPFPNLDASFLEANDENISGFSKIPTEDLKQDSSGQ